MNGFLIVSNVTGHHFVNFFSIQIISHESDLFFFMIKIQQSAEKIKLGNLVCTPVTPKLTENPFVIGHLLKLYQTAN